MSLGTFLDQFPDDEAAFLLAPLREAGHIVRDVDYNGTVAFETTIDGHTYVGRGDEPRKAACHRPTSRDKSPLLGPK